MLLQPIDNSGYPVEYLTARIAVRKSRLTSDYRSLLVAADPLAAVSPGSFLADVSERSAEGVWEAMLAEYRWVYRQMDTVVRKRFTPFFIWLELKTIVLCLRNMQAGRSRDNETILHSSQLSSLVKSMLAAGSDLPEAVARLETTLVIFSPIFSGVAKIFKEGGVPGLEIWLNDAWFHWAGETTLHPALREFFAILVDFHNMMRLDKALRWKVAQAPDFLKGGRIRRRLFVDTLARGDRTAFAGLLRRFPGMEEDADPAVSPETALLRGIDKRLRQGSREADYDRIVEYLWLMYRETRNMGILLAAGPDNREGFRGELL